jgi:nucleotidyltransferase/DNA polymerase involved in DNA repair
MSKSQAKALCSDLWVVPLNDVPYLEITEAIGDKLQEFTPNIELIAGFWKPPTKSKKKPPTPHPSGATYYLDLGKLNRKDALFIANQLKETFESTFGLSILIGLASNRFTAGVAVRFAQLGSPKFIQLGSEASFLAALSVMYLPLDKETAGRMYILDIKTLGALASRSSEWIFNQFGKSGRVLHQLAQGNDTQPIPLRVQKPTLHIQKILDGAVENESVIEELLQIIGSEIHQKLNVHNLAASSLSMILYLDDGSHVQIEHVLRDATANGKLMGRYLMRLFKELELSSGVVEVSVMALGLNLLETYQLDLFGTPCIKNNRVSDLLHNLNARFGGEGLYHVHDREPTHWLPEKRYTFEKADVA